MPRFKAVFFDAGNTLLLPNPSVEKVCAEVLAGQGYFPSLEDVKRGLDRSESYYEERYRSDDSFWASEREAAAMWSSMYALAMEEAGVGDYEAMGRLLYDEFGKGERWSLYPDVLPIVERLHEAGIKMGIISNWDVRLPELCHHLGLSRYLEFVISSANLGRIKPQHSIFKIALERIGVDASQAAHIGDHYYADILGARSAGIYPILLDRRNVIENPDCPVITSLHELPDLVL
jgi:putative hydrolase of the HAD superfamily